MNKKTNFKYRKFDNTELVVTQEEHEDIQQKWKEGKTLVALRNDTIGLHQSGCRGWGPCDDLTDLEKETRESVAKLPLPKEPPADPEQAARLHCEYRKTMNWEHPPHCYCKQHEALP